MPQNFPKKEIKELLVEQSNSILQAVDTKFARFEVRFDKLETKMERELTEIRKSIQEPTATLNKFILSYNTSQLAARI